MGQSGVSYDKLSRISGTSVKIGSNTAYATSYSFVQGGPEAGKTTSLIENITQNGANFHSTYDSCGNITSVTQNGVTTTYIYDRLGQLIRVNDPQNNIVARREEILPLCNKLSEK